MTQKKINLKTALLQPINTAVPHTLFGVPVHIRRLTVCELMDYDEGLGRRRQRVTKVSNTAGRSVDPLCTG